MTEILKLNPINSGADKIFGKDYTLKDKCENPAAIVLRSFNMHSYTIAESVLCVGRAGAGVNNIPIDECSKKGIVVFNTPGANANAVKELTLCALLLASRRIIDGITWANGLKGDDVAKQVESGKKAFAGKEILGKKLGVIGLGAIGQLVANAALKLDMEVYGYDPYISIDAAWNLNHNVKKETDINVLFADCDYITLHVPYNEHTKNLINAESLNKMKKDVSIINCSRAELVNDDDIITALNEGKIAQYITDFPNAKVVGQKGIITIPHLGASTEEAEDNCAFAVSHQILDFLQNGNITNSVNFPPCSLAKSGVSRITVIHKNVKNVLNSITDIISNQGINMENFVSRSHGEYAYTIIDMDAALSDEIIQKIKKFDNIVKLRII